MSGRCDSHAKPFCCAHTPVGFCDDPATAHARSVEGVLHWSCEDHVTGRWRARNLAAAHPITFSCRHPDSRWHDHGCEIPTVEDVRVPEHEGAAA